ncbi:hypothetical protein [Dyella sp. ASV21]|uniref:hypothetical protein n=1 Tax=Dyella sp. ASV21 TaxID=2795114 RepID=UPI0018ED1283|nr:hypothetical protein [Dyella sp. ASV21]
MGLFSSKKKIYVSSVVYPLGEDGEKRTDMMKHTVLNAMLQKKGIAESIRESYLRGQGMMLRNAFAYARDKYTNGLPTSSARYSDQPDLVPLKAVLDSLHPGYSINVVNALISTGDFEWWAERYLTDTYGYDRTIKQFDAPPKGVEVNATVAYDLEPNGDIRILLMNANGATTLVDYRPTDYVRMGNYVQCVYQTVRTFDGGTTTSTRPANPGEVDTTIYSSDAAQRTGESQLTTTKTVTSISGSTATVTVSKQIDVTSRPKYLLYLMGTGKYPSLDAMLTTSKLTAPYFPSIPLRVDNVSWTTKDRKNTPLYKTATALLKKVGLNYQELGDKVTANKNIKDIDYCFVTFGVRLNTRSPEGKRYLFRYFSYLRSISKATSAQYNTWVAGFNPRSSAPPINSVEIYSERDRSNNHDVKLQWQYIDTRLVAGQVKPNALIGDVEIVAGSSRQFNLLNDMVLDGSTILARRQVDANTYEELAISGLTYENFIYKGKSVIITAHEAMANQDEEGFIIPLNQEIVRATPMVELTNLSYQCMYMVFNCYKVVKQKWYQTGLFKIIIVIVSIIIIVCTWGAGTPVAASMMAAAFVAAGVAISLAIVLAATLYVLAVMVLMSLLMDVSTDVFGEKWGPIIGAVLSIVAMNYSGLGTAAAGSTNYLTAQNIINASSALAQGYVADQMGKVGNEMAKATEAYNASMKQVEDLARENLGTNLDLIDVQGLTQATFQMNYEQPDTFLNRTLMTGSDVCNITTGLIENFVDVGLRLPTTG